MIRRRITNALATGLLGVSMGLSGWAQADDTDIYLSGTGGGQEVIRPNVLLVLDTSDSMNAAVPGTGLSRLENMRIALADLLNNLDNVNVGFMRFTGHRSPNNPDPYVGTGGPVIFPVANLDAAASTITGEPSNSNITIQVRVDASEDDAEELLDTTVLLDDQTLGLGERAQTELTLTIDASSDDGFQEIAGDVPCLAPPDGCQDNRVVLSRTDFIGLRFPNVAIPTNVLIREAEVSFTAHFDQALPADVRILGVKEANPATFANLADDIRTRPVTAAFLDWSVNPWFTDESYTANTTSPDFTAVVQEIVDQAGWASGNAVALRIDDQSASDVNDERRAAKSFDDVDGPTQGPRFHVAYQIANEPERVGLRFQNVLIPQGATIQSAFIDFIADDPIDNTTSATLDIEVEDVDDSAAFTTAANDISGRSWTGSVAWSPGPVAAEDDPLPTVDITSLVQGAVDRAGWCGSASMSFMISGSGRRAVKSWDDDPTKAPTLRVTFSQTSIPAGQGCIDNSYVFQVAHNKDDARQRLDDNNVALGGPIFLGQTTATRNWLSGLRFPGVTIDPGADVLSAVLEFTARDADSAATTVTIYGDESESTDRFSNANNNIGDTVLRPRTSASVSWSPPVVAVDDVFQSPDLSTVIEEIVDGGGLWTSNNAMGFYLDYASGSGHRKAFSFNNDPFKSPRLRVTVREYVGGGPKTVRARLIELVNQQVFTLNRTPTIETLYEAALYWRGDDVDFGRQRGVQNDGMRFARVSHPGSYTGGTLSQPAGCTDDDPNALACKDEVIQGTPTYESPFGSQSCQSNFMVFLSDGAPTQNAAEDLIENNLLGGAQCGANPKGDQGRCGNELLAFLNTEDQSTTESGDQTVTTYTIGFNISQGGQQPTIDFMQELADNGDGEFFTADTAAQLSSVLNAIFTAILSDTTSFASPALSVNAFNKLFSRDEAYLALFRPDVTERWNGNIKKFNLCSDPAGQSCVLGELLDADGVAAVDASNRIKDDATSVWTPAGTEDGSIIELGGAGDQVPGFTSRILYTEEGTTAHPGIPVDLGAVAYKMEETDIATHTAFRTACSDPSVGNAPCDALMRWLLGEHGENLDDFQRPAPDDDSRWGLNDPLHSSPVVVSYGGDEITPIDKLIAGTNDGALRLINAATGEEEFAIIPSELLGIQEQLLSNSEAEHLYGFDLTPRIWIEDADGDAKIEPATDFVRAFVGMRRGGSSLYAFDMTPAAEITDTLSGHITPKFMWRVRGGDNNINGNYSRLAQTWSRPALADVRVDDGGASVVKTALIMGGGYDTSLDADFGLDATGGSANNGNALFIIDAETGALIRWISSDASADIVVPGMDYSIGSAVSTLDTDGDGIIDRFYVGDTGGNIWRVDLGNHLGAPLLTDDETVVGQLASLSVNGVAADERVILERPDIIQVEDDTFTSGNSRYDLIVMGTGNRPDPLSTSVQDRVFAVRDVFVDGLIDADANHIADDYPQTGSSAFTNADLSDITDNAIQDATGQTQQDAVDDLKDANGWLMDLEGNGEKMLAAPITLAGKVFITTYLPETNPNPCAAQEGSGQLYAVNVLNGTAVIDFNDDGTSTLDKSDRTLTLGSGIPSQAVPVFQEEGVTLLIGTSGGAAAVDPEISLPRERTYWFDQGSY